MPTYLQAIIIGLPPNATFVDTHLAEQLQKILQFKNYSFTLIMFIRFEDKQQIVKDLLEGKDEN
jgi:hypothetical protein